MSRKKSPPSFETLRILHEPIQDQNNEGGEKSEEEDETPDTSEQYLNSISPEQELTPELLNALSPYKPSEQECREYPIGTIVGKKSFPIGDVPREFYLWDGKIILGVAENRLAFKRKQLIEISYALKKNIPVWSREFLLLFFPWHIFYHIVRAIRERRQERASSRNAREKRTRPQRGNQDSAELR